MPESYGVETSGNFTPGHTYIIVTEGTTDWNYVAATGSHAFPAVPDIIYRVGDVITAVNPDSGDSTGTGTARRVDVAGSFNIGSTYIIIRLGTTNWNTVAGTSSVIYKVGDVLTAATAGSGDGIASRINAQLGRIGGKALKDNLERHGIDLAFRNVPTSDPVLYLKVSPNITNIVASTSMVANDWYKIRSINGTDYTALGAASNTVGEIFQTTGPAGVTSYGPHLITNGTFDTDLSGWTATGSGTLTWNPAGTMTIDATGGISQIADQQITVTPGNKYKIRATHLGGGINSPSTDFTVQVLDSTLSITYVNLAKVDLDALGTPGYVDVEFTPTDSLLTVRLSAFNCTPEWDDVRVNEITISNGTVYEIMYSADPTDIGTLEQGLATGIGIKTEVPYYHLDVNGDIETVNSQATNYAEFDNIVFNDFGRIVTKTGPIHISPSGYDPVINFERMASDDLAFNDNFIEGLNSDQNLIFDPSGAGQVILDATKTVITGDLQVNGNINIAGNLSTPSNIIIGDTELDVVVLDVEFEQGIIPGRDLELDLGQDARDSSPRRWGAIYSPDLSNVELMLPSSVTVDGRLTIDGVNNTVFALQSNEDVLLLPDTGASYIEGVKIQGNILTNLIETPALNAAAIAESIDDYNDGSIDDIAIWDGSTTGITVTTVGPGSTVQGTRSGKLGDFYNDITLPDVINTDDSTVVVKIGADSTVALNEQLWYHTAVKPYVFSDPVLYAQFGNGASLDATPISIGGTGSGYVKFSGNTGMVVPSGTSAERDYTEVGDTRWNTEEQVLECFDGNVYIISTGPGEVVNTNLMTDLAIARSLMLG